MSMVLLALAVVLFWGIPKYTFQIIEIRAISVDEISILLI